MSKKTTYIIFALLACLGVFCAYDLFSRGTGNNVDRTVQSITDDNVRAGELVDSASEQLGTIGNGLNDVSEGLANSAAESNRIAVETKNSANLAERCLELNREAKSILNDIERTNQAGTQAGKD